MTKATRDILDEVWRQTDLAHHDKLQLLPWLETVASRIEEAAIDGLFEYQSARSARLRRVWFWCGVAFEVAGILLMVAAFWTIARVAVWPLFWLGLTLVGWFIVAWAYVAMKRRGED